MRRSSPDPIDIHVGSQIKIRRKSMGMSQSALADRLDITFQQVQKYERGSNRVGASRLQAIAAILGVEVGALFHGADAIEENVADDAAEDIGAMRNFLMSNEGIELNKAFSKIRNSNVRKKIIALVASLESEGE
ncbi:MAG: helix-turn-helix domain-containing protein [Proteobacteria bacterium]|nr:helix-turn-helix domain-containing protein [Pseudomonadota bacterium]